MLQPHPARHAIVQACLCAALSSPAVLSAHEATEHCAAVTDSVVEAGFTERVAVTCENGTAILSSDTYPDHDMMTGITGTNEQVPVPAESYDAPIPLSPRLGDTPLTRDAALGVAVNGVPIFDYTGGGEMTQADLHHHQTQHDTFQTGQLDVCGGHAGRGDDYHYHMTPVCMIDAMQNAGDDAIIGWAFDGFPIYGDRNPDGSTIPEGALDVCNGQPDAIFGYRYHTSPEAPYIVQCLMGETVAAETLPRVAPLVDARSGEGAAPGVPPQGGVEDLKFFQTPEGTRSMEYRYQGEPYYIRYTPTETPGCYAFETRTVTNGGDLMTGEFCR